MIDNMKTGQHASKKKDEYTTKSGAKVYLTRQQKDYADSKLTAKPGTPLTAAAREAYPNAGQDTLRQIVNANERNKDVAIYTSEQVTKAKKKVIELVDSQREDIALRASVDVLDREHGKAVQQVQTTSRVMTISIDLTNGLTEPQTEQ